MAISVSSALLTASLAAANTDRASAAAPNPQPTTNAPADTVRLSEAQQIYQLYNQGRSVNQIATSLSLSVREVNTYLSPPSTTS